MIKMQEKSRPFVYLITALIVVVSWINLMFFIVDGDVAALLLTPILFLGVVYLIGGLMSWWNLKKFTTNEFVVPQSQQRFSDFYVFFLFLTLIIVIVNILAISTVGFNGQFSLYWDKFLIWIFNNL